MDTESVSTGWHAFLVFLFMIAMAVFIFYPDIRGYFSKSYKDKYEAKKSKVWRSRLTENARLDQARKPVDERPRVQLSLERPYLKDASKTSETAAKLADAAGREAEVTRRQIDKHREMLGRAVSRTAKRNLTAEIGHQESLLKDQLAERDYYLGFAQKAASEIEPE